MKISILLPYKENYNKKNAGAVSLFVNDICKKSKFKEDITIFGSTESKFLLSKNYVNINLKKNFLKSSNKEYIKKFLSKIKTNLIEILEVHNRPQYIKHIKQSYHNKIFLYFHNDPLTMDGSKTINDRNYLINNTDKIFFNSKWSKERFFLGFKNSELYSNKIAICYQSTDKVEINFKKKKKIISFVGKLNSAKGYDLFGNTIIKILDKYKDWSAVVIGDEKREKINFYHERLLNLGFRSNKYVLDLLKKVSISVICSRWDEPFGRTSLEAASRGSAVIISDKGGLPETTNSALILKKLNELELYNSLQLLINNKKKLLEFQKKNYRNFFLTHEYVSELIDNIRKNFLEYNFYIKKNDKQKIMHVTNFNYRFNGRLHYNTGRRINNGLIRLGHNVITISDRDILSQKKGITDYSGSKSLQKTIIENYKNFKPDIVMLGHADSVSLETLDYLKNQKTLISQWFLDPLGRYGPDYKNNKRRITEKTDYIDKTFLTSDPKNLDFKIRNSSFIPNPVDESFEVLKNYNQDCENDLFFAMSHGVHRGQLKKGKHDDREKIINKLIFDNPNIKFDIYGMNNIQPIWADQFLEKISKSAMGLNLSRGKPVKYYSSDRIAQLVGNGLLTFIDHKTYLKEIFSKNEVIFYKDIEDLAYKINKYKKDKSERKKLAKRGRDFYFKHLNSTKVADFMIKQIIDEKTKNNFIWVK